VIFKKIKKYFSSQKQGLLHKKHILVICDAGKERNYIKKVLKKRKFQLINADVLDEAWNIINEQNPGLVIVNSNIASEGSLDLCIKIKQDPKTKNIPILAIADSKNDANVVDYVQNTDGYLIKPINEKELVKQVEALIIKEIC